MEIELFIWKNSIWTSNKPNNWKQQQKTTNNLFDSIKTIQFAQWI